MSAPLFVDAPAEGTPWRSRRCAYLVLRDPEGRIAAVRAPLGLLLPGGGAEPGESSEQTARRELLEELGLTAGPLTRCATASEWWSRRDRWLRFDGEFLTGPVGEEVGPGEDDHELLWLQPEDAVARLSRRAHVHAVQEVVGS